MGYLPWWAGGLALATISLVHWVSQRRTLGVSGAMERLLFWKSDRAAHQAEAALVEQEAAVEAALLAATREAFSEEELAAAEEDFAEPEPEPPRRRIRPAPTVHLVFLACVAVGGLVGAALKGTLSLRTSLGAEFESYFAPGPAMWAALLGGGFLVGFGTRMAGGCTSGHGLVGCSRFQPASLLSTALFFGTGIGVSFLLRGALA